MPYKINRRMDYVICIMALAVVLFIIMNFRNWMIPKDIDRSSVPGELGTKRVVTLYNRDTYDGITVKNSMEKISGSEEFKEIQFIFVNVLDDPTAAGRLKYSYDNDYTVYFLNKEGDVIWVTNNSFAHTIIYKALTQYLIYES